MNSYPKRTPILSKIDTKSPKTNRSKQDLIRLRTTPPPCSGPDANHPPWGPLIDQPHALLSHTATQGHQCCALALSSCSKTEKKLFLKAGLLCKTNFGSKTPEYGSHSIHPGFTLACPGFRPEPYTKEVMSVSST